MRGNYRLKFLHFSCSHALIVAHVTLKPMADLLRGLKVFRTIASPQRISSVDVFRALAILAVVLFHFNQLLPYGFLGVDLFFVISGLLVGGLLTKSFVNRERVSFWKFVLQRGFKIWPSYYTFLLSGTIIAYCFYRSLAPDEIIPWWDMKRYLLFYQNYTGLPFHWSFDHVWSLCVEEHFYIVLPVLFIVLQRLKGGGRALFLSAGFLILAGIVSKILAELYTNSKDTFSATHNRIDALAWGVLLNLIVTRHGDKLRRARRLYLLFLAGSTLFAGALAVQVHTSSLIYRKIVFHSIVPFCFFLMIGGVYFRDFSRWKVFRVIAYYSYNWYLWHPIFVIFISQQVGKSVGALFVYLAVTFAAAVTFTVLVEERVLAKRGSVIEKLFGRAERGVPAGLEAER